MHRMISHTLAAGALLATAFTVTTDLHAGGAGWSDNVEESMSLAKSEEKDMLMDFTGSDWCGWCIKLNEEVFSHAAFKDNAPKHFVLVELDFPRRKELSAEIKAQNQQWAQKFGVRGYPTIILADAKGNAYARTGYRAGGPEAYIKHLDELRNAKKTHDEMLAKAEKAEGVERAKLLDQAIANENIIVTDREGIIDEIIKLDKDNKAGLKNKYSLARDMEAVAKLARQDRKPAEALAKCDELIEKYKPTGQIAQDIYLLRSECNFLNKDMDSAKADLEKALAAAPQGDKVQTIEGIKKRFFSGE